ncbi:hypothetical protein DFH08DRAFT_819770 [Mycena albidolilacea]|uniref:Uncharacterized protein n=1 Tax=Mycena albidolilacea TaxID=1033008 RepID=A0AAD6ZDM4_9AGAR|nr:hypothetical protein DFH08DRAFT_819770 [Mycena albidolilacea]
MFSGRAMLEDRGIRRQENIQYARWQGDARWQMPQRAGGLRSVAGFHSKADYAQRQSYTQRRIMLGGSFTLSGERGILFQRKCAQPRDNNFVEVVRIRISCGSKISDAKEGDCIKKDVSEKTIVRGRRLEVPNARRQVMLEGMITLNWQMHQQESYARCFGVCGLSLQARCQMLAGTFPGLAVFVGVTMVPLGLLVGVQQEAQRVYSSTFPCAACSSSSACIPSIRELAQSPLEPPGGSSGMRCPVAPQPFPHLVALRWLKYDIICAPYAHP